MVKNRCAAGEEALSSFTDGLPFFQVIPTSESSWIKGKSKTSIKNTNKGTFFWSHSELPASLTDSVRILYKASGTSGNDLIDFFVGQDSTATITYGSTTTSFA